MLIGIIVIDLSSKKKMKKVKITDFEIMTTLGVGTIIIMQALSAGFDSSAIKIPPSSMLPKY